MDDEPTLSQLNVNEPLVLNAGRPSNYPVPATCSVIIPVHAKATLTKQCLDTLLTQPEPMIERQIIVVDDGSSDTTPRLLAGYGDRITVITHQVSTGFAGACNAGAAAATGDFLVFLNNDTIPQPTWLSALVAYAQTHPDAGIVGAKLLYPDDTIQHAGVAIGYDLSPRHIYVGFPSTHPAVNKSRQYQVVTGACLLIRRQLWDALGGFDMGYRNGWEDVDLCLRARQLGAEVHYCHESVVYHLESVSRDVRAPDERANRERFRARWKEDIVPDDLQYYFEDDLLGFSYQERYPIGMTVSPRVAVMTDGDEPLQVSDRLLAERARQATILLKNNILLNLRLHEAELRTREAEQQFREAVARRRDAGREPEPSTTGSGTPPVSEPEPARIIGSVERPGARAGSVVDPSLPVSGWALSPFGIARVETYLDGELSATLVYGLPRPDIATSHPDYPDGEHCGFTGTLSVAGLAPGEHTLLVRMHDKRRQFADATLLFHIDGSD